MSRTRTGVAGLLSTALILAGCAALPTTGEVRTGVEFPVSGSGAVDLLAEGPQGGETPQQIVDFFLSAQAAWQSDDFEAAEAFLTEEAREAWNPNERVLVHRGDETTSIIGTGLDEDGETQEITLDVVDPDAVSVTIEKAVVPIANVSPDGVRTEMDPQDRTPLRFQVILEESGEWRIGELPNGIVVSQANFDTIYQRVPLYFLSFDRTHLIPEIRWVPGQTAPQHVVQGLLSGPSEVWARTLFSEFAASTPAPAQLVTVDRGVAEIELPPAVTALDAESRAFLQAQFDHSFRALRGINRVELLLNGQPLNIGEPADVIVNPTPNELFYTLEAQGLFSLTGGNASLVRESIPEEWFDASDVVVDHFGAVRAVVNAERTEITVQTNPSIDDLVLTGTDISDVNVDRFGWYWFSLTREIEVESVPTNGEGGLSDDGAEAEVSPSPRTSLGQEHGMVAVHPDGTVIHVPQSWITAGTIVSVAVSYDGSRIAAVTDTDGVRAVELSGVERDTLGRPRSIDVSTRQAKGLQDPTDVAWLNDQSLMVIAQSATNRESMNLVDISGTSSVVPSAFESIRSFSVGSGTQSTYVLTDEGELHYLEGTVWQPVRDEILWADYAN